MTSPLVAGVTTEVGSVIGTVEGTVAGVGTLAGLSKRSIVDPITAAVSSLKTSFTTDLSSISKFPFQWIGRSQCLTATDIECDVSTSVVPLVQTALTYIATSINTTIAAIVSSVAGSVVPLAPAEVEELLPSLSDIESIVSDIQSTLETFVAVSCLASFHLNHLPTSLQLTCCINAKSALAPEISVVMTLALPLVTPIAGFAFSVAGTIAGSDSSENAVRTVATDVLRAAEGLLSPVGNVLSSLVI